MIANCMKLFKRLLHPHSYCSDALIETIRNRGGDVGDNVYIYDSCHSRIDLNNARFISIGNNTVITEGVVILGHDYSYMVVANSYHELLKKQRRTVIGNNVFVGMNSIILMGANIGDNVIIGAGSVVTGVIMSDSVYAGNPARRICSLEEYYVKLKEGFAESARVFSQGITDYHQMGVYRILFEDDHSYLSFIRNKGFHGIATETLQNLNLKEIERSNWDDFISQ